MTGRCGGEVKEDFPHHKLKGEGKSRGGGIQTNSRGANPGGVFPHKQPKAGGKAEGGLLQ